MADQFLYVDDASLGASRYGNGADDNSGGQNPWEGRLLSEHYWSISTSIVIAWSCWLVGTILVLLPCAGLLDHPFAALGGVVAMFGCMTMLRCWIHRAAMASANAFALGRASMQVVRD